MAATLSQGSTGEDVRILQAVLNYHRRGADALLDRDGIFGPMTHQRVQGFQQANLLAADGIVGPNTAGALMTICRTTSEYVVQRDDLAIGAGGEADPASSVTREYELKDGIVVNLDPWEKPPAKAKYVLEFEASWVIKNPRLPAPLQLSVGAEVGRTLVTHAPDAPKVAASLGGDDLGRVGQAVGELLAECLEDRRRSPQSRPDFTAPKSVTGSVRDHIAIQGWESPLCIAVPTSVRRGPMDSRNRWVSVIATP